MIDIYRIIYNQGKRIMRSNWNWIDLSFDHDKPIACNLNGSIYFKMEMKTLMADFWITSILLISKHLFSHLVID